VISALEVLMATNHGGLFQETRLSASYQVNAMDSRGHFSWFQAFLVEIPTNFFTTMSQLLI